MANSHIPIVLIDMAGFSKLKETPEQRAVLLRFDKILDATLQPFLGRANPREILDWQGTGDGWYINMKGCSPAVAMRFAIDLEEKLITDNPSHPDYPLQLRIGLVFGDVERVREQWLSRAYTEAARLIDHPWTKAVLADKDRGCPTVLVASTLFISEWRQCSDKESKESKILDVPPWTQVKFTIKHEETLLGYLRIEKAGPGSTSPATCPWPVATGSLPRPGSTTWDSVWRPRPRARNNRRRIELVNPETNARSR